MPLDGNKHVGHRERLKERFAEDGLDCFQEHNILELLLFYSIPRKDTNEIAHTLLERFGSLEGVFNADIDELTDIHDVGEHTACFLRMFAGLIHTYINDRKQNEIINGIRNIMEFAVRKLAFFKSENLLIFFIDNKQSLLSWHCLQEGCVSADNLDNRTLIRMLMGTNATHVVLARNYISPRKKIGKDDFAIARSVSSALNTIGIGLYDYIVVCSETFYLTMSGSGDRSMYGYLMNMKGGDSK